MVIKCNIYLKAFCLRNVKKMQIFREVRSPLHLFSRVVTS